jgi:hypothetical protein
VKRTRRVEVIRYRRRSAHIQDENDLEFQLAAEQAALDALLKIHSPVESSDKTIDTKQEVSPSNDPCVAPRRTPMALIRLLMRRRHKPD